MIKDLLFERPRLQRLHLIQVHVVGNGGVIADYPKIEAHQDQSIKRLPALKALIIDGYNWDHTSWESTTLWDWSKITHLELKDVQLLNFLSRIQPQYFSGLKSFIEETRLTHEKEPHHRSKSTMLLRLVQHTTALEELKITCDTQNNPIVSTIAQFCLRLRTLSLRSCWNTGRSWWKTMTVDQLRTISSSCPQLMNLALDLTFPTFQHEPSFSSVSGPRTATTSTSTIMTRSMSRAQTAEQNANGTDRYQLGGEDDVAAEAKQKIPRWYIDAYLEEGPGRSCQSRRDYLTATAREQQIPEDQAWCEYQAWKLKQNATLKNQVHVDPTPALAEFRNLRRLTIFTRYYFIVAPDSDDDIRARTREPIRKWLDGLLLTKQGAKFEKITFYVDSRMVSDDEDEMMGDEYLIYKYTGRRDADGAAEISEYSPGDRPPAKVRIGPGGEIL